MITVLSPAKDLSNDIPKDIAPLTRPVLLDRAEPLVKKLRGLSSRKLASLMELSDKLAELNHARYQAWTAEHTPSSARPAVFLYNGEAYRGLGARSLAQEDLRFAQHHLRILSGLYGYLRPLDLIREHRLEMGTALPIGRTKDLYGYWGEHITEELMKDLAESGSNVLVNLASTEYFKAVRTKGRPVRVITPVFKDLTPNGYRTVMIFAKHQRGAMVRHIIQHRLLDPEALKGYTGDGYRFAKEESTPDQWVFLRDRA